MNAHRRPPARRCRRQGSAIVLCMLAVAVLSLSSLAIVRGHRRLNARVASVQNEARGRAVAEGLLHRHIARVRSGGAASSTTDPALRATPYDRAFATAAVPTGGRMQVSVNLFPAATVPTPSIPFDVAATSP